MYDSRECEHHTPPDDALCRQVGVIEKRVDLRVVARLPVDASESRIDEDRQQRLVDVTQTDRDGRHTHVNHDVHSVDGMNRDEEEKRSRVHRGNIYVQTHTQLRQIPVFILLSMHALFSVHLYSFN